MPYENRNKSKGRQTHPPTPQDIARHNRALTSLLNAPTASSRATADDLLLFLDSRGVPRSDSEQIGEALREGPCSSLGHSVGLGDHQERVAITHSGDATQIQLDGEVIAVLERSEVQQSMPAASLQSSAGASIAI